VRSDWQILQFVRAAKVASFSSSRFVALRFIALRRSFALRRASLLPVDLRFVALSHASSRSVAFRRASSRSVALRATPSARTSCQLGSNRVGIKFALPPLLLVASTGARRMESALS